MENACEKTCETCRQYLGGGYSFCREGLERECAEGDCEAWEPKNILDALDGVIAEV